jgi:pilus assembly protein CpaF
VVPSLAIRARRPSARHRAPRAASSAGPSEPAIGRSVTSILSELQVVEPLPGEKARAVPPKERVAKTDDHAQVLAAELRVRLIERRRAQAAAGERGPKLEAAVRELVDEQAAVLSAERRAMLAELVLRDTVGLGPLEELLADPEVSDVMVNGPEDVYVERRGRIERATVRFESEQALRDAIERVLAPAGRRVDELSPMADARLPDGSRVNVVIPPLSVEGPALSVRRFTLARPDPDQLVACGTLDGRARRLLETAVRERRCVLVSGGTGSGKTTLLNALSSYIAPHERVITIEDAAELRLHQPHVVRLESRPASVEGRGEVTIRDLLRNALRMRPDRIVIGEVRGAEALDLLTALNTGHDGALSTVHANSPADAVRRLETLALMAGVGIPHEAIREQLGRGLDLLVHLARDEQGSRRVVEVGEVVPAAGGVGVREVWKR